MQIEQIKEYFQDGLMTISEAKEESKKAGYNMVKIGASKSTGFGGNWVWFKA